MTTTRHQFIQSAPAVEAAFDLACQFVRDQGTPRSQGTAPLKELKIMADAGPVAWDRERFQLLDKQDDFDSIHPSLVRQSKLNNNYGLCEVIPGTYQVRGLDLWNNSFVLRS